MSPRDYPPAGSVHVLSCPDAPFENLIVLRAGALRDSNDIPHDCLIRNGVTADVEVVVERVDYERHDYEPSTILPPDAVRHLCEICRGTHGDNPPRGTLVVVQDRTALGAS